MYYIGNRPRHVITKNTPTHSSYWKFLSRRIVLCFMKLQLKIASMWFWLSFKLLHVFSCDLGDCKVHTWFILFSSVLFLAYLGLYVVCSFVVFYTISDIFDEKRLFLSFVSISCLFSSRIPEFMDHIQNH